MSTPHAGELLGGRYVLGEPIGEGTFAVVFRAHDRQAGRDVAVKLLCGDGALEGARREYQAAHDACHPCIASALDVGRFGAAAFLVMELAAGEAFDRALAEADVPAVASALDSLAAALSFLHARGLVHGDLKPDNVRVAWAGGRPRVQLLDLGLARRPGEAGGGSTAYAAPELLGGTATFASDLFSLGVTAYEVLSKALPFGEPEDPDYLGRLARGQAAPLPEHVPGALAGVLARLLSPEPASRYGSAGELRAALRQAVPGLPPAEEQVPTPPLVERERALRAAGRALEALARTEPTRLLIAGGRGTGRSRLLARIGAEARLLGLHTLECTARHGAGHLLGQLAGQAETLGAAGGDALGRAGPDSAGLDSESARVEGRFRPALQLQQLLDELSARRPVLVLVDDLDRAPTNVRELVHFILAAEPSGAVGWAVATNAAPAELSIDDCVQLPPLTPAGVETVVGALLPGVDGLTELADLARERTGGVPAALVGGVQRLAAGGAIRFAHGQWRRSAEGLPGWAFGPASPAALADTLGSVPSDVRRALSAAALVGGELKTAFRHLGIEEGTAAHAADVAVRCGLAHAAGTAVELIPGEVCAALAGLLDPEERRRVRECLVAALSESSNPRQQACRVRHLWDLGRTQEAEEASLRAVCAASEVGDVRLALDLLDDLRRCGAGSIPLEVALDEARMRAGLGDVDGALEVLEGTGASGTGADLVARLRGGVLGRAGRYDEAIETLERLVPLGTLDEESRYWLGWSLMMRGRYDDATALVRDAERAGPLGRARYGRLLGTIAWHRGDPDRARELLLEARADARDAVDPLVEVEVEQSLGTAERLRGDLDAAAERYRHAIQICRDHGFATVLAKAFNNLAIVHYQAGRWEAARHAWESMQELAVRLGVREEILLSHNNLGLLFRDRGELERALSSFDEALRVARHGSLRRYEAMALGNRADALTAAARFPEAAHDLDEAERLARSIGASDEVIECRRRRAALSLARGLPQDALPEALAAAEAAAAAGTQLERGNALLIAASAARALGRPEQAGGYLATARAAIGVAGTRLERARLELEHARLAAAVGDREQACRRAQHAAAELAELGARLELAEARDLEHGEDPAQRNRDLFALLRCVSDAVEVGDLLERVLDHVLVATGAERGFVVMLEGPRGPYLAARRPAAADSSQVPDLSRGIADRVVASGRALVLANVGEELELASRASVVALGLRAALCAPLMRGSRCLGLLYVDSREGGQLARFGPAMLEAAAAVAAPALERLLERHRDRARELLLHSSIVDRLEAVSAIDASLDLIGDEADPAHRRELVREARARCAALAGRAEGVLELLQAEAEDGNSEQQPVDVDALVAAALSALEEPPHRAPQLEVTGRVLGDPEQLGPVLARLVECAARLGGGPQGLVLRASPLGSAPVAALADWRPGATAGRSFLAITVRVPAPGLCSDPFSKDLHTIESLSFETAERVVRRAGGRLRSELADGELRIAVELERERQGEERAA